MATREDDTLTVPPDAAGDRLDRWLAGALGESRRRTTALIARGAVTVERAGRWTVAAKGTVVVPGQRVRLAEPIEPADFDPVPEPAAPLEVVWEGAGEVVVAKPAGQPCHPLRPGEEATLVQALLGRYPEMTGVGYARREAGLVHRLDVGTSGLVLAARSAETFEAFRTALREGALDKRYLAWVVGEPRPQRLSGWLVADRGRRVQIANEGAGAPAEVALVRVERLGRGVSQVEVAAPIAGRHQVRAMLAAAGFPLLGDPLYGGPRVVGLQHHALHASRLVVPGGPDVSSPPPPALEAAARAYAVASGRDD